MGHLVQLVHVLWPSVNCSATALHHHQLVQELQKVRVEVLQEIRLVEELHQELDEVVDKVLELDKHCSWELVGKVQDVVRA